MAMSTSIVARGCFSSTFFSIYVLVFAVVASAQSVASTNQTLPTQETNSAFVLQIEGSPLFDEKSYIVVPLTVAAGKGQSAVAISAYNIQGIFKLGNRVENLITDTDVALISCDTTDPSFNGNASEFVGRIAAKNPQAIVLYSKYQEACTHSGDYGYQSIYSMTTNNQSQDLLSKMALYPSSANPLQAVIYPNTTNIHGTPVLDTNNEGGPAPTTAVAMSILYSITGIITLLFLIVITTGAIRAHRHPERYGPINAGLHGRQRQSRAKGLARAMLESLPIVKFGDPVPVKNEAENGFGEPPLHTNLQDFGGKAKIIGEGKPKIVEPNIVTSIGSRDETQESDLGCSICTEDFLTGEDLRVLPCNHKFHPACVDPWLLNVCGTCPLCRLDLRPASDVDSITQEREIPLPLSAIDESGYIISDASNPHRNRIARFLDLNRLRQAAPDESLAVLRQLRQQLPVEAAQTHTEDAEERSRKARLTKLLKDAFHIKTRTQTEASLPPT